MVKHKEEVAKNGAERTAKARAAALAKASAKKHEQNESQPVTGERLEPGSGYVPVQRVSAGMVEMMSFMTSSMDKAQIDTARTADDVGELVCGMDDIISRMEVADAKLERIMAGMRAAGFEIPS